MQERLTLIEFHGLRIGVGAKRVDEVLRFLFRLDRSVAAKELSKIFCDVAFPLEEADVATLSGPPARDADPPREAKPLKVEVLYVPNIQGARQSRAQLVIEDRDQQKRALVILKMGKKDVATASVGFASRLGFQGPHHPLGHRTEFIGTLGDVISEETLRWVIVCVSACKTSTPIDTRRSCAIGGLLRHGRR